MNFNKIEFTLDYYYLVNSAIPYILSTMKSTITNVL